MKKKFVISEVVILLVAVLFILFGVFYNSIIGAFTESTDPNLLGEADVGKTFTFECIDNFIEGDGNSFILLYFSNEEDGLSYLVKTHSELNKDFYNRCCSATGTYQGKFLKADESIKERVVNNLDEYYISVSEFIPDFDYESDYSFQQEVRDTAANYYIEVVSINSAPSVAPKICAYVIGVVLLLVLIIRIIGLISKVPAYKIGLVTVCVVSVILGILVAVTFNKLRTAMSIKEESTGLYSMTFYGDLKSDKLLEANISTTDDLINWMIKEQFYGIPITVDEENFGCASFVCTTPDGDHVFGRNFDYNETDAVVIYTNPENGYASYSLSDLTVLGLGEYGIKPSSLEGRLYMMAAPYMCLDGVNEAGLSVGILELDLGELHQDNGKPDLLIYCAIRELLDNCANVDEAIELLGNYDIHSAIGVTYHLHVADKSGRSVVIEWLDGKMCVNELTCATNSVLTPGEHFDEGDVDERIDVLMNTLEDNDGVLTLEEARNLLDSVSQQDFTEWSCVYNLDKFEVTVYMDEYYDVGYTFGGVR